MHLSWYQIYWSYCDEKTIRFIRSGIFRFSVNLKFVFEIIFKINVVAEGQQFETLDFQ